MREQAFFLFPWCTTRSLLSTPTDIVNMHSGAGQSRLDWACLLLAPNSHWFKTSRSILDWPACLRCLYVSVYTQYKPWV